MHSVRAILSLSNFASKIEIGEYNVVERKLKENPASLAACKSGILRRANSTVPVTSRYLIEHGPYRFPLSYRFLFKHDLPRIASRYIKITLSLTTLCFWSRRAARCKIHVRDIRGSSHARDSHSISSRSIKITGFVPPKTMVVYQFSFIVFVDPRDKQAT